MKGTSVSNTFSRPREPRKALRLDGEGGRGPDVYEAGTCRNHPVGARHLHRAHCACPVPRSSHVAATDPLDLAAIDAIDAAAPNTIGRPAPSPPTGDRCTVLAAVGFRHAPRAHPAGAVTRHR